MNIENGPGCALSRLVLLYAVCREFQRLVCFYYFACIFKHSFGVNGDFFRFFFCIWLQFLEIYICFGGRGFCWLEKSANALNKN